MLTVNRSLRSTNLPARIWLTVLGGIGEKPGPTTNGCWKIGDEDAPKAKELSQDGTASEAPTATVGLAIAERGVAKVDKKEGTEKFCLPCEPGNDMLELVLAKAPPDSKKDVVRWPR